MCESRVVYWVHHLFHIDVMEEWHTYQTTVVWFLAKESFTQFPVTLVASQCSEVTGSACLAPGAPTCFGFIYGCGQQVTNLYDGFRVVDKNRRHNLSLSPRCRRSCVVVA